MDDQTLEREIEAMLAVQPSVDFRARLRQRIAEEPPLGSRRPVWRSPAFAVPAAALAAIALVVVLRVDRAREPAAWLPARPMTFDVSSTPAGPIAAVPVPRRGMSRSAAAISPADDREEPEVILDASEVAAWHRLLRATGSGRVEIAIASQVADESSQPLPEGFVVPPVIIEPLTTNVGEQGVHP